MEILLNIAESKEEGKEVLRASLKRLGEGQPAFQAEKGTLDWLWGGGKSHGSPVEACIQV